MRQPNHLRAHVETFPPVSHPGEMIQVVLRFYPQSTALLQARRQPQQTPETILVGLITTLFRFAVEDMANKYFGAMAGFSKSRWARKNFTLPLTTGLYYVVYFFRSRLVHLSILKNE